MRIRPRSLSVSNINYAGIRKDVEAALKVSQATAILILRDMVEKGLLIREGSGKQQKYRIVE